MVSSYPKVKSHCFTTLTIYGSEYYTYVIVCVIDKLNYCCTTIISNQDCNRCRVT